MKTKATEMLGMELPIFAFSHCRDVVAEVSKAGGFGVLGGSSFTPEQLEQELRWIDEHSGGRPYGVDLVMPTTYEKNVFKKDIKLEDILPKEQVGFANKLLDQANIPELPEDVREEVRKEILGMMSMEPAVIEQLLEVTYSHPQVKLIVSALGAPAKHHVERAHSLGIKVGALAGSLKHALKSREAGVDLIVAQGYEAGGHTGQITSMILWPELAEALDVPVLAAGGVGRGNQMAAALAMGAAGVWCGSIWLGTRESETTPEEKEIMFKASSADTVQSKHMTGKPVRMIRNSVTDAWAAPDAPKTIGAPRQVLLWREPQIRIERAKAKELLTPIVGQVVGMMKKEKTVKRVIEEMLEEFIEAVERLNTVVPSEIK
ncbi:NAD(P)H-dependent flavin oxidoreductase [Neobacillus vireti]|uniref:NAD(P)H-dependent flavin oxidoreductase n=1 Tax=Neobacillus vireti TaxID=220686 RepID=UPI002FFFACA8